MQQLMGKAQDKEFWAYVREADCYKSIIERLKKEYAENMATGDLECHKYSEFKLFWTTGNRTIYEKGFNHVRSRANRAAVLALIYPEEQEYLDTLMDSLYAICDEYSWCLPAHHGKLEVNDNARIDLTASTTAAMLSEIYTVLEDRLEPLIKNRIKAEIDRRIVTPFCSVNNYGWWEGGTMNWTAVCISGVTRAIMLMRPDLMTEGFILRTNRSMERFLTGFDSMGICFEGAGYWSYGFGHFVTYAEMLRRFTDGKVDFFKIEKVKNISAYFQKMFLSGDKSASFSDGGAVLRYPVYLMHFLKDEYPDDVLVYTSKYASWDAGSIRSFSWYNDEYMKNPAKDDVAFEMYAPEAQWMIKKTAAYGFAAKGGDNNEFHNHNDVGSFVFAKNGEHVFTDPGGGQYTRQYFAADTRYTMVECSSRGHSVPIIGGEVQKFGKQYAASDAKYESGVFSLEMAGAYAVEGINSVKRSFAMSEDSVTVTDIFDCGDMSIVDRIVTRNEPEIISENEVKAGNGSVTFDPSVCELKISSEQDSRNNTVWFIDLALKEGVNKITYLMK